MIMNPLHETITNTRLSPHLELHAIFIENFASRVDNQSTLLNNVLNRFDT